MKALSIRQPWAWAILNADKDIENRSWPTNVRGRVLVHAGLRIDTTISDDWIQYIQCSAVRRCLSPEQIPAAGDFPSGGIVGSVEIVDCVRDHPSPWFFGPWGFVLANPRPLPFVPCKGRLGFFDVPADVFRAIGAAA